MSQDETKDSNSAHGAFGSNFKDLNIDLENWMGQLPEHLTKVPLIHLSIPGSHNSFSYSISPSCGVSPDCPKFVQVWGKFFRPLTNNFIFNWSQGQSMDVEKQLKAGIRYFDVRLVSNNGEIVIAHGLFGGPIEGFLEKINAFLQFHKKEVVILDFQHFYEFTEQHHEKMFSMMLRIFANKICLRRRMMRENTLQTLWSYNHQILIVYRHQVTTFNDVFWASGTWATPWYNKINCGELFECLEKGLSTRKDGIGYVSQGILTPTTKYVALHAFGTLRSLAKGLNKKLIPWLESKKNGPRGINVVICDFVEMYDFCEKVILLNYRGSDDEQIQISGV